MRVQCQYSGLEFTVDHFGFKSTGFHPIFGISTINLLSLIENWANSELDSDETKLLWIAMMKATGLVEFRSSAIPAVAVVENTMEMLAKFLAFKDSVPALELVFPRIVINRDTRKCGNAPEWINIWFERKKSWEDGYRRDILNQQLADREAALEKLIRSPLGDQNRKIARLADWAMLSGNVPKELREYWISLFKLRSIEVYQAKTIDIEELVEHMEDNLQHGTIFASETMLHLRLLLERNRKGLNFGLGMPDDELASFDPLTLANRPYSFIGDDIEQRNIIATAMTAPPKEPMLYDFPSKLEYLRARAAWTLAVRQVDINTRVEQKQKEAMQRDILEGETEIVDDGQLDLELNSLVGREKDMGHE